MGSPASGLPAAAQAGITDAVFMPGRIEDIPLPDARVNVVIFDRVITLSANKARVLAEAFRAAGFTAISITTTSDAGDDLHSAIIQAVKPAESGDQQTRKTGR